MQPHEVYVVGLVDAAAGYMIGLRVVFDAGEPVTIMLPLIFMPTFIRLLQEQSDELQATLSAPRS